MKEIRHQRGFTLIELMIVITIIGVLAGIAIPSMSRQVAKSQLSRVFSELSHYRNPIEDILMTGKQSLLASDAKDAVNFVDSDLSSVVFGSFADASTSTVTATLDERTTSFIHGTKVILSRNVSGSWTCTVIGAGGGWNDRMKPNACN